jgi:hypothetical protein
MSDITYKNRSRFSDTWGDEISREVAATNLADEDNIIGVFWQGVLKVEVEPEMIFGDEEEKGLVWEEKGLVWNVKSIDGSCSDGGTPEEALCVAEDWITRGR